VIPITLRAAVVIDADGEAPVTYTPASSDTFALNDLPGILEVSNASGSPINVTPVDGGKTPYGSAAAALAAIAVPATTGKRRIKLLPAWADSTGVVTVAFSATASVTCEFYR
jgi:hypothetical protein